MLCYLASEKYRSIDEMYSSMSQFNKDALETKYLMYKAGLRSKDGDLSEHSA